MDARPPELDPRARAFYRDALTTLTENGVPFLVGGAYAFARYTGIVRHTKDFDLFTTRPDATRALAVLAARGYHAEMAFPHWLGKVFQGENFIDVIFASGNGVTSVDRSWFDAAEPATVLDLAVRLISAEDMIWQKAFIMERERYDGADVAHILRARADQLDWPRLLRRFDAHWRVLYAHLVLFGFVYPGERTRIPAWVMHELTARVDREVDAPADGGRVCRGTLISRAQYLVDVDEWSYADARVAEGLMTPADVAHWTASIDLG